jgi:hypothetical protein
MEYGLSGHGARILVLKELHILFKKITQKNKTRLMNNETVALKYLIINKLQTYSTTDNFLKNFRNCDV